MNSWYVEVKNAAGDVVAKRILKARSSSDAVKAARKIYGEDHTFRAQVVRNYYGK